MAEPFIFADAHASFEDAKFVILGVPFNRTSSFRMGTNLAPNEIRKASYNFEDYLFEHDTVLSNIPIHDCGNVEEMGDSAHMIEVVETEMNTIIGSDKFPVVIGGEHSVTVPVIKCLKNKIKDFGIIVIDAHLDFRNSYLTDKNNHACVTRRLSDIVGVNNVVPIGVRSISEEEMEDLKKFKLNYINAFEVHKTGIENAIKNALKLIKSDKIYLSLDIDGIDPAYAPGIGTPEPFGLSPLDIKLGISLLAEKLIGFDVVEVCPPYDNGNTSALAARLIRELIAVVGKTTN